VTPPSNFNGHVGLHEGREHEQALEAYAHAVRLYQDIVLELQDSGSSGAASVGTLLERAAAAKATVNRYRSAHRESD